MVLIYAILLPRYLKLTGSAISTVLLGGLTYAAMHIVKGWSAFDSPRNAALSLLGPADCGRKPSRSLKVSRMSTADPKPSVVSVGFVASDDSLEPIVRLA